MGESRGKEGGAGFGVVFFCLFCLFGFFGGGRIGYKIFHVIKPIIKHQHLKFLRICARSKHGALKTWVVPVSWDGATFVSGCSRGHWRPLEQEQPGEHCSALQHTLKLNFFISFNYWSAKTDMTTGSDLQEHY